MSSRDWKFRIEDIITAIERIEQYLGEMTLTEFRRNQLVIDAVVRNFEIIGEAGKSVPSAIQRLYPDVPWVQMSGMRNILIHEYFGVDVKTVWHTAKKSMPELKRQLRVILQMQKT